MPNVPPDTITALDVVVVNQQGVITLSSDGEQYKATCSSPPAPALKEGGKLRIMHRDPTAVVVQRIIYGQLDDVEFHLVFNVD
jgi:hypothetical protein